MSRKQLGMEAEVRSTETSGTIKVRNFAGMRGLLLELGADVSDILRVASLDPNLFSKNDNVISYGDFGRLVTACIDSTGCPDFGFKTGVRLNSLSLGLTGLSAINAKTVGDALGIISDYLIESSTGATLAIHVRRGGVVASIRLNDPNIQSADQIAAGSLAKLCNIMREICGSRWRPQTVQHACRRPRNHRIYSEFYGVPIQWDASEYALGFDERQLQNTIKARDDQQYELLHSLLEREVSRTKPDLRQDIKTVLRTQLGTGSLSLSRAAAAFDLGERSFARRVERAGLSFSRLLDEVKYEAACTLLRTDLKLTEIAAVLFYSELGAFTRAFKRWSGETPKSWRQKHAFPKERALR